MGCVRRDSRRRLTVQEKALSHPLRVRILELHKRARGRSLSVKVLTEALSQTPEYAQVKQAEVRYHRALLADADLIPAS